MAKQNTNQQPNTAQQDARADMWDMLNAFISTPDLQAMQFTNEVGELILHKAEKPEQRKPIGFDTTYAVAHSKVESDGIYDNYCNGKRKTVNKSFVRWVD